MTILNNTAAAMTLGELNKNVSQVGKQLAKVSSGQKITGAGDGASEYSISERMRVQIRGLEQDIQNAKNGKSLLRVAEGGIQSIIDELRGMRELALKSANDTNTDLDRATIQKEFNSRRDNIDDIANTTNYNGKLLLRGTVGGGGGSAPLKRLREPRAVTEPSDPPATLGVGGQIDYGGVWIIPRGFTGTIAIADSAKDVKLVQEDPSTPLTDVFIQGPSTGEANLWIENLNIANADVSRPTIQFYGTDNVLSFKGTNELLFSTGRSSASIHIGDGLEINGTGKLTMGNTDKRWEVGTSPMSAGALIGTDANESRPDAYLMINSGEFSLGCNGEGAMIGAGGHSTMGDIIINGGTFDLKHGGGASCLGSGQAGTVGDIYIRKATIHGITDDGAVIGSGWGGAKAGDIYIQDATIDVSCEGSGGLTNGGSGAGIGSGANGSSVGNITIQNSNVDAKSTAGEDIGAGVQSTAGKVDIDGTGGGKLIRPLIFQTGTKANQALFCYIMDMGLKSLGIEETSVSSRPQAVAALGDPNDGTVLGPIDKALEYALDNQTRIGAYMSRLEETEENLVTAHENTTASESTIRDADMAKEMAAYTKANILQQASQSMLAQANQTASSVLSLLQ